MTAYKFYAPGVLGELAAPVGGATGHTRRCWGCHLKSTGFVFAFAVLFGAGATSGVQANPVLPSGLDVSFHDLIAEPPTWRVRYLAPALAQDDIVFDDLMVDMQHLCDSDALPLARRAGADPTRVVITLMSEPVTFGVMTPTARQFFESYEIKNDLCIWEAF